MFKRYSKEVIEPFALKTIASSFDKKYELYHAPKDTDNFDYVSPKNDGVLEVTTAIPENVMNAYIYENERAKGKDSLKTKHIKK